MKLFISQNVEVSLEEIKQSLSFSDYKEMADYFSYQSDFKDEMIEALCLDESDHLDNISNEYMDRHIKGNIGYYDVTKQMQNEIEQLKYSINNTVQKEVGLPENPHKAYRFFCDLFGVGYHVSKTELLQKISDTM